jgi:hypothetical protein
LKHPLALKAVASRRHPTDTDFEEGAASDGSASEAARDDPRLDDAHPDAMVALGVAGRSLLSWLTDDMRGGD